MDLTGVYEKLEGIISPLSIRYADFVYGVVLNELVPPDHTYSLPVFNKGGARPVVLPTDRRDAMALARLYAFWALRGARPLFPYLMGMAVAELAGTQVGDIIQWSIPEIGMTIYATDHTAKRVTYTTEGPWIDDLQSKWEALRQELDTTLRDALANFEWPTTWPQMRRDAYLNLFAR